jgi:AcrR family transcriptional regulator
MSIRYVSTKLRVNTWRLDNGPATLDRVTARQRPGTTSALAGAARAHTGRARNEQVRQAILDATMDVLMRSQSVTIESIASQAGVGKQTIYRWWPSKSALVLEAITDSARDRVRDLDSGDVRRDVRHFLASTFRVVSSRPVGSALRAMLAEALHDPEAADVLREYTAQRRAALGAVLQHGVQRGQVSDDADIDLAVEQAFGFLWYRLLFENGSLGPKAAESIGDSLLRQLGVQPRDINGP